MSETKKEKNQRVYELVFDSFIEALEQKQQAPWVKTWSQWDCTGPKNITTGKQYRGINYFMFNLLGDTPFWATKIQTEKLGGSIKKDQLARPKNGVFFDNWFFCSNCHKPTGAKESCCKCSEPKVCKSVTMKPFEVYNITQIEGLDHLLPKRTDNPVWKIEEAEQILTGYVNPPSIDLGESEKAYYMPPEDKVVLPYRNSFTRPEHFYQVMYHELAHSTGHNKRLDRAGVNGLKATHFGSMVYSHEELIAEMTAGFLCAKAKIDTSHWLENSASYLDSWIKHLKQDKKKSLLLACQSAQHAADRILGTKFKNSK